MITEQQILDLGFTRLGISTDTKGTYEYIIARPDLSGAPNFYPSHIYWLEWGYGTEFTIHGWLKRPNKEGIKERKTKTINCILNNITDLEDKIGIIIRSDTNNYTSSMRSY